MEVVKPGGIFIAPNAIALHTLTKTWKARRSIFGKQKLLYVWFVPNIKYNGAPSSASTESQKQEQSEA